MSCKSTIIYNTSIPIGFSSYEGNNKNSNSKNYKTITRNNLDTILEKKGENKYVTNTKILKKLKKKLERRTSILKFYFTMKKKKESKYYFFEKNK